MYVDSGYHFALFNIQRITVIMIITTEIGFIYLFWYIFFPIWVNILIKIIVALFIAIMHCAKKPIPYHEVKPVVAIILTVVHVMEWRGKEYFSKKTVNKFLGEELISKMANNIKQHHIHYPNCYGKNMSRDEQNNNWNPSNLYKSLNGMERKSCPGRWS